MRAPVAGTVAEVPFAVGDRAGTGDAITVLGSGSAQVTVDVPEASIGQLKVGQSATVAVPTTKASAGEVTAIGVLPVDSSSDAVSYPVTITVPKPAADLAVGVTVSVAVTVASPRDVVVVPVSAITRVNETTGRVTVLQPDGSTAARPVSLGATGGAAVEITAGVKSGDRLVIADRLTALPTATTGNRRATAFGAGSGGGPVPGGGTVRGR